MVVLKAQEVVAACSYAELLQVSGKSLKPVVKHY